MLHSLNLVSLSQLSRRKRFSPPCRCSFTQLKFSGENHMTRRFLTLALAVVFSLPGLLHAQSEAATGVITGIVADPNGAVLSQALIRLENVDTGLQRSLTTNDQGIYRAALLPL